MRHIDLITQTFWVPTPAELGFHHFDLLPDWPRGGCHCHPRVEGRHRGQFRLLLGEGGMDKALTLYILWKPNLNSKIRMTFYNIGIQFGRQRLSSMALHTGPINRGLFRNQFKELGVKMSSDYWWSIVLREKGDLGQEILSLSYPLSTFTTFTEYQIFWRIADLNVLCDFDIDFPFQRWRWISPRWGLFSQNRWLLQLRVWARSASTTVNIARGTTDPGYWLFNLSYLSS